MPTVLKVFHNSGEWDQPADLVERNVRRLRRDGHTLGTRTEVTTAAHHKALHQDDGWRVYHPRSDFTSGYIDCAVEWDGDVWAKVETRLIMLNETRLRTQRDFLLPPSTMPLVVLQHRATGRHVAVGAFHLQLANTERRRAAWRTEATTIRSLSIQLRREHPGWEQIFQGDGNRNQRITALRNAVHQRAIAGTRLHNCWEGYIPIRGGTHGSRSILDLTLTTMPGASYLLPDDGSSDHRPYATDLRLRSGK